MAEPTSSHQVMHLRLPVALLDSLSNKAASLGMSRPEYVRQALRTAVEESSAERGLDPLIMAMILGPDYEGPPQDIPVPARLHDRLMKASQRRGLPFPLFVHEGLSALADEPVEITSSHTDDELLAFAVTGNVAAIIELADRAYDAEPPEGMTKEELLAVASIWVQLAIVHPRSTPMQRLLGTRKLGALQIQRAATADAAGAYPFAHEMAAMGIANLDRAADHDDEECAEIIAMLAPGMPQSVAQRARKIRDQKG